MSIYKLKVLTCDGDHENSYLKDFYFDMNQISGFFIPKKHADDAHIEGDFVTLVHSGCWTNVLQEPHVIDFLMKNFVDKAIQKNKIK